MLKRFRIQLFFHFFLFILSLSDYILAPLLAGIYGILHLFARGGGGGDQLGGDGDEFFVGSKVFCSFGMVLGRGWVVGSASLGGGFH